MKSEFDYYSYLDKWRVIGSSKRIALNKRIFLQNLQLFKTKKSQVTRLTQDGMPSACSAKIASLGNEVVSFEAITKKVIASIRKPYKEEKHTYW